MTVRLVASMLTADTAELGEECARLEAAGIDGIHWDIMDGVAVPSLSFGPDVVAGCRPHVSVPFEAHVMVSDPEPMLSPLRDAGCDRVILHPDTLTHPWRTAERVGELGMGFGLAVSPGVPLDQLEWLVSLCDGVLVMTVEPGYGGQAYLPAMEPKIRAARHLVSGSDLDEVEVDGGIAADTIAAARRAGANAFVVGSALWRSGSFADGIEQLRQRSRLEVSPT